MAKKREICKGSGRLMNESGRVVFGKAYRCPECKQRVIADTTGKIRVHYFERPFCEAKTRKQIESPYWGESKIGCGNRGAIQLEDGHWVCRIHADETKRYGWND